MNSLSNSDFKELINSKDGIHYSAYFENVSCALSLKDKIESSIEQARKTLQPILSKKQLEIFLDPLINFKNDYSKLEGLRGNVGLFRKDKFFKLVSMPVELSDITVIAKSFHIKPLIKNVQQDHNFLFLGFDDSTLHLYQGSLGTLKKIDEMEVGMNQSSSQLENISDWIKSWASEIEGSNSMRLYVAGTRPLTQEIIDYIQYKPIYRKPVSRSFDDDSLIDIISTVREIIRSDSYDSFNNVIQEYRWAVSRRLTEEDIHQISKSAIFGRIDKLIIADGVEIFGKINESNGDLHIHYEGLDHEDDDLLDDLAQAVLTNNGEVVVVDKDLLPKNRPIMAILKPRDSSVPKFHEFLEFTQKLESKLMATS